MFIWGDGTLDTFLVKWVIRVHSLLKAVPRDPSQWPVVTSHCNGSCGTVYTYAVMRPLLSGWWCNCRAHPVSCVQLCSTSSPASIIKTAPTISFWNHRTPCRSSLRRSTQSRPTYRFVQTESDCADWVSLLKARCVFTQLSQASHIGCWQHWLCLQWVYREFCHF